MPDTKEKDPLDLEAEELNQPDHSAPLRADIMGSMIKANPATPGYLGTLDHLMTAHGAVEDTGMGTPTMSPPGGKPMGGGNFPGAMDAGGSQPPTMNPKPQGWLGKIGHGLARMGNIAGDVLAPGAMLNIPGTDLNKRMEANRAEKVGEREQQLGIEQQKADTERLGVTQRPELAEQSGELRGRLEAEREAASAQRQQTGLADADKRQQEREKAEADSAAKRDADATTRQQAQFQQQEKLEGEREAGQERRLQETLAARQDKTNEKQEAAEQAGLAAQQYADDYMASKQFTGPGDEALMEKYFELAKPSSGFRMTETQIQMLMKARDIMNSLAAQGKHLFSPDSPYFSDTQRQQIVQTMKNLQKAREEVKPQAGGGNAPPKGAKVVSLEDFLKGK